MQVTDMTRRVLKHRRGVRDLRRDGFEEVGEGGGKLWELYRGFRSNHIITDVVIAPNGKSLFIKTAERQT